MKLKLESISKLTLLINKGMILIQLNSEKMKVILI